MPPQPAPEPSTSSVPPAAIGELQSQLRETQNSLAGYADKFHLLDSLITEHGGLKHDIGLIKEFMEERRREAQAREQQHRNEEFSTDDDDTRSVATVVPHELGRVDEEDEEAAAEHEDRRRSSREVGRPRTPEPSLAEFDEDDHHRSKPRSNVPEDIIHRLETLSGQLESALELSRTLQAQQVTAKTTIQLLEIKVTELQQLVQATQTKVDNQHEAHQAAIKEAIESVRIPEHEREKERESLTAMINEWKKGVEGKWSSVQEEWSAEKDRLRRARDEWELKTKTIEDGLLTRVESRLSVIQQRDGHPFMNGSAKPNGQGLVTPPSPRSLSSDSMRPRSRKKRNGSSRGRTKSPNQTATPPANTDSDEEEPVLASNDGSATSPGSRPRSPWTTDYSSDSEGHADNTESSRLTLTSIKEKAAIQYPITPESSLVCAKEEPPRLDSGVTGSSRFVADLVSRTFSHVHARILNWFTARCTVFHRPGSGHVECRSSGSHVASETGMNVGPLADSFVFAYGIPFIAVATYILFFLLRSPLFIVHMTSIPCFEYVLGYLN